MMVFNFGSLRVPCGQTQFIVLVIGDLVSWPFPKVTWCSEWL